MSSRRITSNPTLAPIQKNALNPFSEFNSDNINLLTRIVSGGKDVIIKGLDVLSAEKEIIYETDSLLSADKAVPSPKEDGQVSETVDGGYVLSIRNGLAYGISYIEWNLTNISDILGTNTEREFEVSFKLKSGKPKCIFVTLNNDTSYVIDHPVPLDNEQPYTFLIKRNLCNDKNVKFRFNILFDALEDWNLPTNIPMDAYNRESTFSREDKTVASVKDIDCRLSYNKYGVIKSTAFNSLDYYSNNDIHPTSKLKITPGIAIKDDVMIDIKGKTYAQQDAAVILDLSSDYSWIKGKGYQKDEFIDLVTPQFAFSLNGRSEPSIEPGSENYLECGFREDGKLIVKDDNHTEWNGPLLDDIEYRDDDDVGLSNEVTYTLNTETKTLMVDLDLMNGGYQLQNSTSGTHLVFVYEDTNLNYKETFFTFNATLKDSNDTIIIQNFHNVSIEYSKLSSKIIEFINSKEGSTQEELNRSLKKRIKIYISSGPIKILSKDKYYNKDAVRWAYVVLYYAYFKNPRPNISYIGLAKEKEINDPKFKEDYLILAKVRFIDYKTVDIISYNERQVATFPSSNSINYFNDCSHPEVWQNSVVPKTVTNAIDQLRSEINDLKYFMRRLLEGHGDIIVGENFIDPILQTSVIENNPNS